MFPGRVGAVFSRLNKQESHRLGMPKKAPTLTAREQELELAKIEPIGTLKDFDIYELNNRRLRFRKYPWPFWLIGGMFANGVLFLVYLELTNQIKIKNTLTEVLIISFMLIMAFAFIYTGKIKSTIFDKKEK